MRPRGIFLYKKFGEEMEKKNLVGRRAFLAGLAASPLGAWLLLNGWKPSPKKIRKGFHEGYFPNVPFTTHRGKRVRFYRDLIRNKIVVIHFMYTFCQGVCLPVTANLAQVQKILGNRMGRDIFFYSITLDPERDSPETLNAYARRHHAGRGWVFLTGLLEDIDHVRRKMGFVDPDPVVDRDKSQHAGMLRYGNERLQRWSGCPGQADPAWIAKAIRFVDWPKKGSLRGA